MIRTILVALDGSSRAPSVLDAAAELARAVSARLVLYRTMPIAPDFRPAGSKETEALSTLLEREARAWLLAQRERVADLPCEIVLVDHAQPWRAIIHAADSASADLIVIGSHGYHGWDHLLGTTAGKVANTAHRSVLVVHHAAARP